MQGLIIINKTAVSEEEMMCLMQIDVGYACYGITTNNSVVVDAAPIARWMIGKSIIYVSDWVKRKRGTIKYVYPSRKGE